MRKIKKKKNDYTFLLHIAFAVVFIAIILAFYFIGGQKDLKTVVKSTEDLYKEKVESTQKIKPEQIIKQEKKSVPLPPFEKFKFKYTYTLNIQGSVKNLVFRIPIPSDEVEKQYISSLTLTPTPTRTYHDGINNVAEFSFNSLSSGRVPISIEGIANIRTYNYKTATLMNKNINKENDLTRYLKSEPLIESDDNYIKSIAKNIKGTTTEEIVQNIYEYAQQNLKYTIIPRNIGAKEALKIKQGKCSEYSAVMAALCRTKGIPARIVFGNIARQESQKHSWVEVYFDKYGWVAYDPTARGTFVRIYDAKGNLVRTERKLNSEDTGLKYIASGRNDFTPWRTSYAMAGNKAGRVSVNENIQIANIK